MKKIVIFASGNGSNAQAIINHFENNDQVQVTHILSNKPNAFVLKRATQAGIEGISFNKFAFAKAGSIHSILKQINPDLIVLAGFLWKIPEFMVEEFPNRIVNIHPALLPKYGGKGMYGNHVHGAVLSNKEKESGITIHYVNEHYDEGGIIHQATCPVLMNDTIESLANRIHQLEHEHFPVTIEKLLS
ncbi:phosphoribosylglycinamide formyltransferase [Nonlabens sp. MIC269]|uniref:phosphoribosylglycinamide formyltransferase n=1 Tax=Nonlabens TaxID=363408 RepID=UPI000720BDE4|nr:phosphoribosylglycinamide formyltransferase [Nonlabens sp. MIC269]ALM20930.1 phosphoribosylglycinamide formyltransferase [Nonlabens sp. MIC269]